MQIIIFGQPGCPYCVEAKNLADKVCSLISGASSRYIDIREEGITKADLEARVGGEVKTVPQIFIGDQYIGGYTEFAAHIEATVDLD